MRSQTATIEQTENIETTEKQVIKVLQVEDDDIDRKTVERILKKSSMPAGFSIESFDRLKPALQYLAEQEYDIALLDLGLPDSKGLEIIQKVRDVNPNIPIVVLTGLDDEETGLLAIKNGANDYLIKGPQIQNSLVRAVLYALERKKADEALRESEHKYRTLLRNIPQKIFYKDLNSVYLLCNESYADDLEMEPVKIAGKTDYDFYPKHIADKYVNDDKRVVQNGKTEEYEEAYIKNGQERIVHTVKAPIRDHNNEVIGILGIFWDITESKKAQLELQLAEERYRTIFENSAIAIMMADENEQLVSWNKFTEKLLDMDEQDLYLKPVKSLYPAAEWENIRKHNIRRRGMQHHLETKMFRKNGAIIDVDLSLSVLSNAQGTVSGTIGVVSDITERKNAERKIKEAMEMKSEFISTVSHELRTPLTSMKEGISIVLDGAAGPLNKDQKNFLDIAKRNVERLTRLINDVLDFQKLDSGKMSFNMTENDINETAIEVHNIMSAFAKNRKLKLALELEENLPKIKFDRDRIIQVLTNLVNNAIKFTEKGKITIGTSKKENVIIVSVSDTGHGIKQEDLQRLFNKFVQLEKNGDRKTGGTGLGLAISKEIIEQHNAKIWAESEEGRGTAFYFVLPIVERRSKPRRES
jgi:PAS domain S-box-containing protein